MQFVFKSVLIYTGVASATTDKNDENDPSQDPKVLRFQRPPRGTAVVRFKRCPPVAPRPRLAAC